MNNQDYTEDLAAIHEPNLDIEGEMWCMEFNHEYGFGDSE